MNKAPTAIICLSDGTGGLESDAIKYTKRLSSITETILIVKSNTFLSKKAANVKSASDAATAQATLEATYGWKRANEYPSIGDQLDMIYHNGDGGATFQAAIKAVKDKYPKE